MNEEQPKDYEMEPPQLTRREIFICVMAFMLSAFACFVVFNLPGRGITNTMVDYREIRCVEWSAKSVILKSDGWKLVTDLEEYSRLSQKMRGYIDQHDFDTLLCYKNSTPHDKFPLSQVWWRKKTR